jgi:phosphoglycolate phosphatase
MEKILSPKVILFDWDGTLVNTNGIYRGILHEVLEDMGINEWNRAAEDEYRFYSRRHAFPIIFGDKWEVINEKYIKKIDELGTSLIRPFDKVVEVLEYFTQQEVIMSVVSNKEANHLRDEIKHLGWDKYFHKIIGAADAEKDKPFPDPVYMAMTDLDIKDYKNVWFVGDSVVDIKCAINSGCIPVFLSDREDMKEQVDKLNIDYIHAPDHDKLINIHRGLK